MTKDSDDQKNDEIVRTTIRLDRELHEKLRERVYEEGRGKSWRDRPSIDGIIQAAVTQYLSKVGNGNKTAHAVYSEVFAPLHRKLEEIANRSVKAAEAAALAIEALALLSTDRREALGEPNSIPTATKAAEVSVTDDTHGAKPR